MARTRPSRSPSQPKRTPPVAAPIRNPAVAMPYHVLTSPSVALRPRAFVRGSVLRGSHRSPPPGRADWLSNSFRAGLATSGNSPISMPSKAQPSKAAVSAIHLPELETAECCHGRIFSWLNDGRYLQEGTGNVAGIVRRMRRIYVSRLLLKCVDGQAASQ